MRDLAGEGRRTVGLVTLGCPKNEADSARLATLLAGPFDLTEDLEHADVVVVNTCGFIESAVEESLQVVMELAQLPGRPLVVAAGCVISRYEDDIREALPEAGLVVPLDGLHLLPELIADALEGLPSRSRGDRDAGGAAARALWAVPPASVGPSTYVTISDGCSRGCTFCTIPGIRGGFTSRPARDVLAEAKEMVAQGARELVLVGQDTGTYGLDLPSDRRGAWTLARLLGELAAAVGDDIWLRVMYLQPDAVDEHLVRAMAELPGVCRYLDMPVQHVDEAVLRSMGRQGSAEEFRAVITGIRAALPGVVLRTTVMVGFPGERREAFEDLERFVADGWFDYVGVFAYSREEGTSAALLPRQVRSDVTARRMQRLVDIRDRVFAEKAAALEGQELDVLTEGPSDEPGDDWVGRWRGQAPEVDGGVYWSGPEPSAFARVRVQCVSGYDLMGVAVP